jgi:hypothetical protein
VEYFVSEVHDFYFFFPVVEKGYCVGHGLKFYDKVLDPINCSLEGIWSVVTQF